MILSIDQGTTGTRVLLVDESGAVRASAYREITQHFPQPGWVEHDAEEIWGTVLDCSAEILAGGPTGLALAGMGVLCLLGCGWRRRKRLSGGECLPGLCLRRPKRLKYNRRPFS